MAIDYARIRWRFERTNLSYCLAGEEQVTQTCRRTRTVDQRAAF